MDFYYLNRGESFSSDKDLLCVDNSSELYHIETDSNRYIAWNRCNDTYNLELCGKECLINQLNFYSVLDNSLVLIINEIYDLNTGELISKNDDVIVEKLSTLLNIKGNQKYIFTKEDILNYLGDEKTKLKQKKKVK